MAKIQMKNKDIKFSFMLLFLAFIITISSVLTGVFLHGKYTISVDSVSPKRFKAPREVVNEVATDRLKEQAAQSVPKLYVNDPTIYDKVISELDMFYSELNTIYFSYQSSANINDDSFGEQTVEDSNSPQTQTASSSAVKIDSQAESLNIELKEEEMAYLLAVDYQGYTKLKETVYNITKANLELGIKEESMAKSLVRIKDEIEELPLDATEKRICYEIIASFIKPNSIVDEIATNKAVDEKIEAVKPIVFYTGQNIVDEGEIVTEEIFQVLANLGYINTGAFDNVYPVIGCILTILLLFFITCLYIYFYEKELLLNRKKMLLLFSLYSGCVLIARAMTGLSYQFVPILILTMLVAVLIGTKLSILINICMTIICAIIFNENAELILYFFISGIFSAIISRYTISRNKVFIIGIYVSLVTMTTFLSLGLLYQKGLSKELLDNVIFTGLNGILTVVLCIGSLPLWESLFGINTPYKLMELTNPNSLLLRRLIIEAPGTYHHSLIVANLAESAAYDIGANTTLCRVGGYYHDIGKLIYPQYFSENQTNVNLHDELSPRTSVKIITDHLAHGLVLADENKLPQSIKDIIIEHHGTTVVKYFYHKAQEQAKEGEEIDINDFRYKYPKPHFKEAAIVMLADTVEAAVRSMIPKGKTMDEVKKFVTVLVMDKLGDGQLSESHLEINDLQIIINSFMCVFKGMYHQRIPYPNQNPPSKITTEEV